MEEIKNAANLALALSKFQGSVGIIPKNKEVQVRSKSSGTTYTFKYADLSAIWEAITEPLVRNELSITQVTRVRDNGECLVTKLLHSSGEVEISERMLTPTSTLQEYGSQLTYLKRYQLTSILGICADDDDDANAADGNEVTYKNESIEDRTKLSDKQKSFLESLLARLNEPSYAEAVCKKHKLETIYDINRDKFNDLVENVKSRIEGKKNAAA